MPFNGRDTLRGTCEMVTFLHRLPVNRTLYVAPAKAPIAIKVVARYYFHVLEMAKATMGWWEYMYDMNMLPPVTLASNPPNRAIE